MIHCYLFRFLYRIVSVDYPLMKLWSRMDHWENLNGV